MPKHQTPRTNSKIQTSNFGLQKLIIERLIGFAELEVGTQTNNGSLTVELTIDKREGRQDEEISSIKIQTSISRADGADYGNGAESRLEKGGSIDQLVKFE